MTRQTRVFISSARGYLDRYRTIAADACRDLGLEPVYMEEFDPTRRSAEHVSAGSAGECEALILLLGHRYGTLVPGREISYSEFEYESALANPQTEIMVWIVDDDVQWPASELIDEPHRDKLQTLKQRVQQHIVGRFGSVDSWTNQVMTTLARFALRTGASEEQRPRPLLRDSEFAPALVAHPPYSGSAAFTGRLAQLRWIAEWARSGDPVAVIEAIGGTGKSALTWEWLNNHAHGDGAGHAGRFWWSFYDPRNSFEQFQLNFLNYAGVNMHELDRLDRTVLADRVSNVLDHASQLIVLDGFERLQRAYHHVDSAGVSEADVAALNPTHARAIVDPEVWGAVRRFASAGKSKILITTRLLPDALVGPSGIAVPGVRALTLPGLTVDEVMTVLDRLEVRASRKDVQSFFGPLGNHPLLIQIVAGIVRKYRPAPRDLSRWLADPAQGGGFRVSTLPLREREHHILEQAMDDLSDGERELLQALCQPLGPSSWSMVEALNPFRRGPFRTGLDSGTQVDSSESKTPRYLVEFLLDRMRARAVGRDENEVEKDLLPVIAAYDAQHREVVSARNAVDRRRAEAELDAGLDALQARGLLWWDREANSYDLHPVVRSFVKDTTSEQVRRSTNARLVRDHFGRVIGDKPSAPDDTGDVAFAQMYFYALSEAGSIRSALNVWQTILAEPLVYRYGDCVQALRLLENFTRRADQSGVAVDVRWDQAVSEAGLGNYDRAFTLELDILHSYLDRFTASSPKPMATPTGVASLLCNLSGSALALDRSAYNDRIGRLVREIADATPEILHTRNFADQVIAHEHLARFEPQAALEVVGRALEQEPSSAMWPWRETMEIIGRRAQSQVSPPEVTQADLTWAANRTGWGGRLAACEFVRRHAFDQEDFDLAYAAAWEYQLTVRRLGRESFPFDIAQAAAELGRVEEATQLVNDGLARLDRINPFLRPTASAASALLSLDRADEARPLAVEAFERAWADGPSSHDGPAVRDIADLLAQLGVVPPELPDMNPNTIDFDLDTPGAAYIEYLQSHE